jgi:hypothetical protein
MPAMSHMSLERSRQGASNDTGLVQFEQSVFEKIEVEHLVLQGGRIRPLTTTFRANLVSFDVARRAEHDYHTFKTIHNIRDIWRQV